MSEQLTYEFTQEGFFNGDFYRVGDTIRLHPKQAKFEGHRLQALKVEKTPSKGAKSRLDKAAD